MRSGNRFARAVMTVVLGFAVLADVGCQKMFNVMFRGNENGGQLRIDGPDFRANVEGGRGGGRVDIDAPGVSIHTSARNRSPYRRPPIYGPMAPGSDTPDYSMPLAPGSSDPQAMRDSGPAAPQESYTPAALDRFAGQQAQKDGADVNTRAKADPISLEEAASEVAMLEQINAVRSRNDVGTLGADKQLDIVARRHSEEMASLGYFDHKSPVEKNKTLSNRMKNDGVNFRRATENIARVPYRQGPEVQLGGTERGTAQTPEALARDMMEGYMNSPGHRANILDPRVSRVGLGTVIGSQYAYNTQNFKD